MGNGQVQFTRWAKSFTIDGQMPQGWIKCGSGEQRPQEMTRKIEEIVTLGYEEKEKREEEEREEEEKKKRRKKEEVEIEEFSEEEEEHGDDKLI